MLDVLDMHMHTYASGHAYSTLKEMIAAAREKHLKLIGITEHAPNLPGTCSYLYFHNLRVIPRQYGDLELMMGVELNILNPQGEVDLPEKTLQRVDYAVASLHTVCIKPGSQEENTMALINAMQLPKVKIIGHPDNGIYPVDYEKLAAAAKEYKVLLELNNSSLDPRSSRSNSEDNIKTMLKYCRQYNTPVIMDSDAHIDLDVGNHQRVIDLLAATDFPEDLVINSSVDKLKAFFAAK